MPPLLPPAAETTGLFAQGTAPLLYYLHIPVLIILISLVYSATRFDEWPLILHEAVRWGRNLLGFLLVIAIVLYALATII